MNPWRELHKRFMDLRDEEELIIQQHAPRFNLRAVGTYESSEYGHWKLHQQMGHNFEIRVALACADGAKLLGCPISAHPIDYWIHRVWIHYQSLLSRRASIRDDGTRVLDNLCDCSAAYCGQVELKEMYPQLRPPAPEQSENEPSLPIRQAITPKTFPNRATWVNDRLKERGWDWNDPYRFGGPDRKTVQKLLAGKYVQIRAIEKLVTALNRRKIGSAVRILDVPNN
jgi:hypothetical protein